MSKRRPSRPSQPMVAQLLQWRLLAGAVLVASALILGGHFMLKSLAERARTSNAAMAEERADAAASAVGRRLQAEAASVLKQLDVRGAASALTSGDARRIGEYERAAADAVPMVLRIRLLRPGPQEADYETSPPLTYASVDMLRRSQEEGKAPPPEMQLAGAEDEHLAVLTRLSSRGGKLLGHMLVALDANLVREALTALKGQPGAFQIKQPVPAGASVAVAKLGPAIAGEPVVRKLGFSNWLLAYTMPPMEPTLLTGSREAYLILWGSGALLVLAAGTITVVRQRRLKPPPPRPARAPQPPPETLSTEGLEVVHDEQPEPTPATGGVAGAEEALEVEELATLSEDLFLASDLRAEVGESLGAAHMELLGRAIGSEAEARGQQSVVVARDGRTSSPELAAALVEGLKASGRDVIDIGRVPTPVMYYAAQFLGTSSGVMVTGGHSPARYNGLKVLLADETLGGEALATLKSRVEQADFAAGEGSEQSMDMGPEYIRAVTEDVPVALGRAFKLVVDAGNGIAGELAPKLYRALGHDVVELHCEVDGDFPNHEPDPTQPENLQALVDAVRENQADLGLAFDGDGDRLTVVDDAGNIIWADRLLMLFAKDLLARHQGAKVLFDAGCTSALAELVAASGGEPIMVGSGPAGIKAEMRASDALLAGEMGGRIYMRDRWFGFDDGLYAGARLLEILLSEGGAPQDVFAALPSRVGTPELRIAMGPGEPTELMALLEAKPEAFDGAKLTSIDGLRAEYPDGWGIVRASKSMPQLVLRFEGRDDETLRAVQERFRAVLSHLRPDLTLPF